MKELLQHYERTKRVQSALVYLDKSGNLSDIKKTSLLYGNSQDVILYKFRLKLQPCDLIQTCAYLGNLVLSCPSEAEKIFQEVVYLVIKSLQLLPGELRKSQIAVNLKLGSLPAIKEQYYVKTVKDLPRFLKSGSFLGFDGVVTGLSAVSSYTQSTLYICPVEGCSGADGKQYIRVHVPGASELQTIRNDFHCFHCGMVLEEDKSKRVLAEKLIAELVPVSTLRTDGIGTGRTQAITVYFRDELVSIPVIGELYRVIGVVKADFENQNIHLVVEANNIEQLSAFSDIPYSLEQRYLPKCIQLLYEENVCSPWGFVRCLAYLFGESVTPPGSFHKLKLGILLSLVLTGSKSKTKSLFHILACGRESVVLDRLLRYGCTFAERAVTHSLCNAVTGRISKDPYHKSQYFVEGGSLSLATNGVCNIGDLGRYKKITKDIIKATLDTGRVVIDVSSKFSQGLPQQHSSPLRCHVWAYSDPATQKPSQYKDELFITGDTGELSKAMLDVFSLVLFTDGSDSISNFDEEISRDILRSAVHPDSLKPSITFQEFNKFLEIAREREVILTPAAEVIVQQYYQASRRMRSSDPSSSSVPVSTLPTLYSLALAHAKLSLRREVTESDAVMAVHLSEECLTARHGFSALSVRPMPHITCDDFNLQEMDEEMYVFHHRLLRFCGGQAPGHEE
ncbi:minichromosome maintenance domain-containing protein 2-like [Liolophura sinensis]|uniref:minichromosome maintenance domain-containing protein 2-like n=1 Tax=Liolophura sinensis TaxID=3198878 RepID=UPI003158405F